MKMMGVLLMALLMSLGCTANTSNKEASDNQKTNAVKNSKQNVEKKKKEEKKDIKKGKKAPKANKYQAKYRKYADKQEDSRYVAIQSREDVRVQPSPKVETYLAPYRASLQKKIEEVIAKLEINLTKSGSSSSLGRFASQIILEKAREYSKMPVDFAVLNSGGLRKPLYKGDLKVKDIYELMPFDNYIVVVEVKGTAVKTMCKEIKRHHGLPMAGLRIVTGETEKDSCKVNGKAIDEKRNYYVATINYLYNVGEGVPSLKHGKLVKNMTNRLFRNAIIEYVKEKKVINKIIPVQYVVLKK